MSLSLSDSAEISEEETLWNEKRKIMKKLGNDMWEEAKKLMEKGRISCEDPQQPLLIDWQGEILPNILQTRLNMTVTELKRFDAFHPLIGSSYDFSLRKSSFDTEDNGGIENCVRSLLRELRKENASSETGAIVF